MSAAVIDCHGHYATSPPELATFRKAQIEALADPHASRAKAPLHITDDQIRASVEGAQIRLQRERGTDLTLFSPRAAGMGHHVGDATTSRHWSEHCNELIHRVCELYPDRFAEGELFRDFPTLRFVIPHGGGAVPYHWGRYRGLAQDMGKSLPEHLLGNVFFDTCVYHRSGMKLLLEVIPADNILFASEIFGAVQSIDPETGHAFDDTKRIIDGIEALPAADRNKIYHGNARRVYPRLERARPQSSRRMS